MIRWLSRQEKVSSFDFYQIWIDSDEYKSLLNVAETQSDPGDPESELSFMSSKKTHQASSPESFSLAKAPQEPRKKLTHILTSHASPSFISNLKLYLNSLLPDTQQETKACAVQSDLPFTTVDVWHQLKLTPVQLLDETEREIIRAVPIARKNLVARFDPVLVIDSETAESTAVEGCHAARLQVIFRLPETVYRYGFPIPAPSNWLTKPLAYASWYTRFPKAPCKATGMYQTLGNAACSSLARILGMSPGRPKMFLIGVPPSLSITYRAKSTSHTAPFCNVQAPNMLLLACIAYAILQALYAQDEGHDSIDSKRLSFVLPEADVEKLLGHLLLRTTFRSPQIGPAFYLSPNDQSPLWFTTRGSEEIVPTIYTLFKHADLLPFLATPKAIIPVLTVSADLITPGVVYASPNLAQSQLVVIQQYEHANPPMLSPPLAVGRMALLTERLKESNQGKAVLVIHAWKDHLWEMGPFGVKVPPSIPLISTEPLAPVDKQEAQEPGSAVQQGQTGSTSEQALVITTTAEPP
ncbi:hypothetical protein D9757_014888 [Collybiopsis confluens]|uniref:Eukaryotic translation initiation factor 2D-like PUA RNA-binding domain-containing protein n=1 Tax=Collybiopsis confluens TaxID=2823264 RepID=A0A8H5CSH2_9AGAR|nr:hypothetical protein D9757_014888 [Collybiopsis confluens]